MKEKREKNTKRNWYAIQTRAGYEDIVCKSIKDRIEPMGMQDKVFETINPKEEQIEIRKGKPVKVYKKIMPGYIFVDMIITDESWYMVRNTPNVTGFTNTGGIPVPVTPEEFSLIESKMFKKEVELKINFNIDELVRITEGPFSNYEGSIKEIDKKKGTVVILVSIFDRETPVELDFTQINKIK